jgi:3',5'-cyclic AMP phosphodiesterase CpdA
MAPLPGGSIRLGHVSDIHVGATDEVALDGLAADLHAAGVVATVVTGDLTMRARTHELARARQVIDEFPAPTMVVIGNHDIPLTNPFRRLASPYDRFRAQVSGSRDPVLDLGMVRIQGLDSMPRWRWKSGRISDRQSELVVSTFTGCPAGTVRIVALHHPPSSDHAESIAGGGDFKEALVDAEVDIVLAGHTHVPSVRVLEVGSGNRTRPIIENIAGTATSHRTRESLRSWSQLDITRSTVTVTQHLSDTDGWQPGPVQEFALPPGTHLSGPTAG